MSVFKDLEMAPPDAIFGLQQQFLADTHQQKVNLVMGGKLVFYGYSCFVVHYPP